MKRWGWLVLVGMVVIFSVALKADIRYFWLDHPHGRTNPDDPLYNGPLRLTPSQVEPSPTPYAGTPTSTVTMTPTGSIDLIPTVTPTIPSYSSTPTATFTAISTQNSETPTIAVTPSYSGTVTSTLTVVQTTQTPTPTATAQISVIQLGNDSPVAMTVAINGIGTYSLAAPSTSEVYVPSGTYSITVTTSDPTDDPFNLWEDPSLGTDGNLSDVASFTFTLTCGAAEAIVYIEPNGSAEMIEYDGF